MRVTYVLIICFLLSFNCQSQEIFADYFDINWGATPGTEVMGKLNLKRNKDYKAYPIPKTYQFTLLKDISNSFEIKTEFDPKGRIFGIIKVKPGTAPIMIDRLVLMVGVWCALNGETNARDWVLAQQIHTPFSFWKPDAFVPA